MKLRIGLFTDSYGPSRNGVAVAVNQLRSHLLARGQHVILVAPRGQMAGQLSTTEFLVSSVRIPGVHPPLATGLGFRRCIRTLSRSELDLVHVHGFGPVSLLGIYLAKRGGIPLVVTWHTDLEAYVSHYRRLLPVLLAWGMVIRKVCGCSAFVTPQGRDWSERGAAAAVAAIIRTADVVTAPSEKITMRLKRLAANVSVVTIPTGVDPISRDLSTVLPSWSHPVLLYVGRVAPEKGIDLLLQAFSALRKKIPEATLVLVGDHRCARQLKRRLRRAQDQNIDVIGEVDRCSLGAFYAGADFFVFPSVTDTQALVLHEAAHAGLPLVIVDSELGSGVTSESNTLFAEPDANALRNVMVKMIALCTDQNYISRAAHVGRGLAARFSVERQHQELVSLYLRYARAVTTSF